MRRIYKRMLIFIILVVLVACGEQVKNENLIIEKEIIINKYSSTKLNQFKFIEKSVENSIKYPANYDYENIVRHDFYGDEYLDMPYYAEGYIVDNNEFFTTTIPDNVYLIENYFQNERVLYAIIFEVDRLAEKPKKGSYIQVYGTLTGDSYRDNTVNLHVSGSIPEIVVRAYKVENELVLNKFVLYNEEITYEVGKEKDRIVELIEEGKILEFIDMFINLPKDLQPEILEAVKGYKQILKDEYFNLMSKYSNPFLETYDIEMTKLIVNYFSYLDDIVQSNPVKYIEMIESIRESIRNEYRTFSFDIEDYYPEDALVLKEKFQNLKNKLVSNVEELCYFNIEICENLNNILNNPFFNIFEFYEFETFGNYWNSKKDLTKNWMPTLFFSLPWKPYNGTTQILSYKYKIYSENDYYIFEFKDDRTHYVFRARTKNK